MSITPDEQHQRQEDLAAALRRLRKAAGLSGDRLAARCAMSQSKISRIETGKILPTVVDVERVLKALQVPTAVVDELVDLARAANVEYESWRAYASIGVWRRQLELKALAASSDVTRHFLPAIPTGLIQLPDYIRSLFSNSLPSEPAVDVDKIVSARLER